MLVREPMMRCFVASRTIPSRPSTSVTLAALSRPPGLSSLSEFLGAREWPSSLLEAALRPLPWGCRTGHDLPGGSSCPCIEVIDDFVGEHAGLVGSEQE